MYFVIVVGLCQNIGCQQKSRMCYTNMGHFYQQIKLANFVVRHRTLMLGDNIGQLLYSDFGVTVEDLIDRSDRRLFSQYMPKPPLL